LNLTVRQGEEKVLGGAGAGLEVWRYIISMFGLGLFWGFHMHTLITKYMSRAIVVICCV